MVTCLFQVYQNNEKIPKYNIITSSNTMEQGTCFWHANMFVSKQYKALLGF